jgi:hypothetical protein
VAPDYWYKVITNETLGSASSGARQTLGGLSPTDGLNMAGVGRNSALYQNVDIPILRPSADYLTLGAYTLTYNVGHRADQPILLDGYSVQIWGLDSSNTPVTQLASLTGTAPGIGKISPTSPDGTAEWQLNQSLAFNVHVANPSVTGLQIRLINNQVGATGTIGTWDAYQVNFDNIRLDFTPEPGTWVLMGTVGAALALLSRRRRSRQS